jgi:CBS domain-containing protein
MASVDQLLSMKGQAIHTITMTATVYEAIAKMVAKNVGSLVVMDEGVPCGMLTERDYLRRVALEGRSSKTTFVAEIMSPDLVFVDPETDVEECMALMTHRHIRHLPVLSESRVIGMVSIGDIVKYLARERAGTIQELTAYIQGRYA